MTDTPRSDSAAVDWSRIGVTPEYGVYVHIELARELERELAAEREKVAVEQDHVAVLQRFYDAKAAENAALRKQVDKLESAFTASCAQSRDLRRQVEVAREALEEVQHGPYELHDYLYGIRCGVEDRELQSHAYHAAEYAYQEGLDYCATIATNALSALDAGEAGLLGIAQASPYRAIQGTKAMTLPRLPVKTMAGYDHNDMLDYANSAVDAAVADAAYYKWRLAEIMPLFQEARDAIVAISMPMAKLHGISLDLDKRMDAAGTRTRAEFDGGTPSPTEQSSAVEEGKGHDSDCATHNMPAYPNGPCDCSLKVECPDCEGKGCVECTGEKHE